MSMVDLNGQWPRKWLRDAAVAVAEGIMTTVDWVTNTAVPWVEQAASNVANGFTTAVNAVGDWVSNTAVPWVRQAVSDARDWTMNTALPWINQAISDVKDWIDQNPIIVGIAQTCWGIYKIYKGVKVVLAGLAASATGIGVPLGIMGAAYASYQIVTGANSVFNGINRIIEGINSTSDSNEVQFDLAACTA